MVFKDIKCLSAKNYHFTKNNISTKIKRDILTILLILVSIIDLFSITPLLPSTLVYASENEYSAVSYAGVFQKISDFQDVKNHWAEVPIKKMYALLLMTGGGNRFYPERTITREEALSVLTRLFYDKKSSKQSFTYNTASEVKASNWAKDNILKAKELGIISDEELSSTDFTKPSSREEVFTYAAKALKFPEEQNYSEPLSVFEDAREIDYQKAGYIASLYEKGYVFGIKGRIYPKKGMTRAEFAAFLDRFINGPSSPYDLKEGKVTGSDNNYIYLRLDTGENIKINVQKGKGDFPVLKAKNLYLSKSLKTNDHVKLFVKNNSVLFAEVLGSGERTITGNIEGYIPEERIIKFKNGDGNIKNYYLVNGAQVYYGSEKVNEDEIQPGLEAKITAFGEKAYGVFIIKNQEQELKESIIKGTVLSLNDNGEVLKVSAVSFEDEEKTYDEFYIYPDTVIKKSGQYIGLDGLSPGDEFEARVVLTGQNKKALSVDVINKGRIKAIFKGKIAKSDFTNGIVLQDVKEFYFGRFYHKSNLLKIKIDDDTKVYEKGEEIPKDNIVNLYGREVYAAVEGDEGSFKALKVVVKSGDEYLENGFFTPKWSLNILSFRNSQGIFDDYTIVSYKDGEVFPEVLEEGREAFAVFNKEGETVRIPIVYQPVFYGKDFKIIKGKIYEIGEDKIGIKHQREFEKNAWSGEDSSLTYHNLGDSLLAIDFTNTSPKVLTKEDFVKDRFYKNYYYRWAYVLKKKDSTVGIVITDELKDDVVSIGRISSISKPGETVSIERMMDFSPFNMKWNYDASSLDLDVRGALIVKDESLYDSYYLNQGDRVYFIRDNNKGLIIFKF